MSALERRRLPRRLEIYAIEGSDFTAGAEMSAAVERGVEELARTLAVGLARSRVQ